MHGGDHVAPRLRRAGFAVVGAVAPKIVTDTGKPHWTAPRCTGYSRGCGIALRDELGPRARVAAHRRPPRRRCCLHLRRAPLAARRRRAAAFRPRAARDDRAADETLSGDGSGGPSAARWYSRYAVRYGRGAGLPSSRTGRHPRVVLLAAARRGMAYPAHRRLSSRHRGEVILFAATTLHCVTPITAGVPEQVVMELGGWRTRSVLARHNVTSRTRPRRRPQAREPLRQQAGRRIPEGEAAPHRTRTEPPQSGSRRAWTRGASGRKCLNF